MRFEWDAIKAASNIIKHGVSFEEAIEVFYDPNALEDVDAAHSVEEKRLFIIGLSSRRLLFIVYVETVEDRIRIVSARKASKAEREIYEQTVIE